MRSKIKLHVFLSTMLLLPVAIILENSDGAETVHSPKEYISEWLAPIILTCVISGVIVGIKRLLKRETSFFNVYYHTAYIYAISILLSVSIKYL